MATITIRLRDDEKASLEANATYLGVSVSDLVRQALEINAEGITARVRSLEKRMDALEQLAQQ